MESVRGVVRRAVNILSKQYQMGPKALVVNPQTSYGPEGRGFESLGAYQSRGNLMNFRGFVRFCALSWVVSFYGFGLTQAVTHTGWQLAALPLTASSCPLGAGIRGG